MPLQSTYKVGAHTFAINHHDEILPEKELLPYAPFRTDSCLAEDCLFTLTLVKDETDLANKGHAIIDLEDENGRMSLFREDDRNLTFLLTSVSGCVGCRVHISNDYRSAKAWIGGTPADRRYAFDTTLMLLYTFASSNLNTLLIHASAVEYKGKAYLFLGKSGTGKSTHSRLWIDNIPGAELLNDDNPIIRIVNGKAYVSGSPWSGKTPCYRNRMLPIDGIVRLRQAPFNRITTLKGVKAYAALLPSCSCMKWDHAMAEAIHSTISKLIESIPIYSLECLPDKDAVILCHNKLITDNTAGPMRQKTERK